MKKNNGGFSLVECVVAMAILGAFATAACTSLVLAHRMNGKTESMLQAQLAVSSAIETMMAEGITGESENYDLSPILQDNTPVLDEYGNPKYTDRFPQVKVKTVEQKEEDVILPYYEVTVTSDNESISVTTHIRKAVTEE